MQIKYENMSILPLEEQSQLTILLSQPHRHYHNINHINDLLSDMTVWFHEDTDSLAYLSKYYHESETYRILSYVIWYHDAIYDSYQPYPGYNENMSAKLFLKYHAITNPKITSNGYYNDRYYNNTHSNSVISEAIIATSKHTEAQ